MQVSAARNPLFLRDEAIDASLELLALAQLEMTAGVQPLLARAHLQASDLILLFLVQRHPGLTMAELSRLGGASKQNLSRHVAGLGEKGLIECLPDPQDRRRRLLHVTQAADTLLLELVSLHRRLLKRAFRRAGVDAVEGFRRVLQDIVQPLASRLEAKATRK